MLDHILRTLMKGAVEETFRNYIFLLHTLENTFFDSFLVTKTAVELQYLGTKSSIIIETNEKLKLMGRKVENVKINLSY